MLIQINKKHRNAKKLATALNFLVRELSVFPILGKIRFYFRTDEDEKITIHALDAIDSVNCILAELYHHG